MLRYCLVFYLFYFHSAMAARLDYPRFLFLFLPFASSFPKIPTGTPVKNNLSQPQNVVSFFIFFSLPSSSSPNVCSSPFLDIMFVHACRSIACCRRTRSILASFREGVQTAGLSCSLPWREACSIIAFSSHDGYKKAWKRKL